MPAREVTDMPARIARLPKDRRGYPIPYFVEDPAKTGGEPDFRVMNPPHFAKCVRHNYCWICGQPMGANKAFVVGPMCCVNLISSEPPSHRDCAQYAAQVCPFLSIPSAKRREKGLEDANDAPGLMIKRNPGVTAIWMTKTYEIMRLPNGYLLQMGEPSEIEFWCRGRKATREEVDEATVTGYPSLLNVAEQEGPEALKDLAKKRAIFDARIDALYPREIAA